MEREGTAAGAYITPGIGPRLGRAVPPGGPRWQPKHALWTRSCLARAWWRPGQAELGLGQNTVLCAMPLGLGLHAQLYLLVPWWPGAKLEG
jgi:hypothetical protein